MLKILQNKKNRQYRNESNLNNEEKQSLKVIKGSFTFNKYVQLYKFKFKANPFRKFYFTVQ